ncbi:MAG: beta-galactosidase [Caldilineales bacterium]|nr:beta-galactosidase [Caldilineales bacterium]MDW8318626.1 beta-galactosidase [Anaerolineae bacterium]
MSRVQVTRDGLTVDGRPLYLLAGQVHYFRWPRAEWREVLLKAKAGGLNAVDTVIPWNLHEPAEGAYHFADEADLPAYLDLMAELGLYAIVRPGPYICAEWENGGFPAWLTARLRPEENGLALRTLDPRFLEPTLRWFDRLIPLLAERQLDRGGPILLVQIENEHWASGVYGHDAYQERLAEALTERGITVPLYTCMGAGRRWPEFRNGWNGLAEKLVATRNLWPDNPLVVSELWSGWFDDWGKSRHNGKTPASLDWKLHELLAVGCAGLSHWVWAGGTHSAYWGGRTVGGDTVHMTTSYDYDAPVGEYGQLTEKFYVARRHHLLLSTLGAQLSRLLANDALQPGPRVLAPKAVPGRAAAGSEPYRNVRLGDISATFLQNPTLERQTHQLFLPATGDSPAAHLAVEVEAASIKPIFANLPLADSGVVLRLHTSRLLGFWQLPAGDVLAFFGSEGEVGQIELLAPTAWAVQDADGCAAAVEGCRLSLRYWIGRRPTVVRAAVAGRPWSIVLLTHHHAERWWPMGDAGFVVGPDLVVDGQGSGDAELRDLPAGRRPVYHIGADGRRRRLPAAADLAPPWAAIELGAPQRLALAEREAQDGWQPLARPEPVEALGCGLGYAWYRAELNLSEPVETTLTAPWLADRATVFVDGEQVGVLGVDPWQPLAGGRCTLSLRLAAGRHDLRLLVDNLGRFNYGSNTGERKGLLDTLYWGGRQEDITAGWTALWQEAVFAGEALANAKPAHVRPDAADVALDNFPLSAASVWLLREIHVPAGRRAVLTLIGDRNPGALFVNGQTVARFSRHYGGGYIKADITPWLRPSANVVALQIQDYGGLPWRASLVHFDPSQAIQAGWSFRCGVTPGAADAGRGGAAFWRYRFRYDPAIHGPGPFRLVPQGLVKGQIWLNGRNVGRYWQVGPQEAYKLPGSWLQGENDLLLLDEVGVSPGEVVIEAA